MHTERDDRARSGVEPERVPHTFPIYGNIGPAAIPITLAAVAADSRAGDVVLCMGIGSGLNVGVLELALVGTHGRPGPPAARRPRRPRTRPGRGWSCADDRRRRPHLARARQPGRRSAPITLLCVHGNPSWSYLFRDLFGRARRRRPGHRRRPARHGVLRAHRRLRRTARRASTTSARSPTSSGSTGRSSPSGTTGAGRCRSAGRSPPRAAGRRGADEHRGQQPEGAAAPASSGWPGARPAPERRPSDRDVHRRRPRAVAPADRAARPARLPRARTDRRAGGTAIADFVADIPLEPDHPSAASLDGDRRGLAPCATCPCCCCGARRDPVFSDSTCTTSSGGCRTPTSTAIAGAGHFVSEDVDALGAIVDWLGTLGEPRAAPSARRRPSEHARRRASPSWESGPPSSSSAARRHAAISFAELAARVDRHRAAGLVRAGVRPGDRVALMIPPGIDLAVSLYACWRVGAVVVLIDSGLGPAGMSAAVRAADPAHLDRRPRRRSPPPAPCAGRAAGSCTGRLPAGPAAAARRRRRPASRSAARAPAARRRRPESDARRGGLHLGRDRPVEGGRATPTRQLEAQRDVLTTAVRDHAARTGWSPRSRRSRSTARPPGSPSIVPDMDVTEPRTLTAAALGDAAIAVDATLVFASPAALANVVRTADGADRRASRGLRAGAAAAVGRGAGAGRRCCAPAPGCSRTPRPHTPYGMTECLPVSDISLAEIEAAVRRRRCLRRPPGPRRRRARPAARRRSAGRTASSSTSPASSARSSSAPPTPARATTACGTPSTSASRRPGWHATGDVGHLDGDGRLWIGGRLVHVIATAAGPLAPVRLEQAIEEVDGVASAAVVGVGPPRHAADRRDRRADVAAPPGRRLGPAGARRRSARRGRRRRRRRVRAGRRCRWTGATTRRSIARAWPRGPRVPSPAGGCGKP